MAVVDFALLGRDRRRITSLVEGSFYDGIAGLVDGLFFEEGQERISMTRIVADKFEIEWQAHRAGAGEELN